MEVYAHLIEIALNYYSGSVVLLFLLILGIIPASFSVVEKYIGFIGRVVAVRRENRLYQVASHMGSDNPDFEFYRNCVRMQDAKDCFGVWLTIKEIDVIKDDVVNGKIRPDEIRHWKDHQDTRASYASWHTAFLRYYLFVSCSTMFMLGLLLVLYVVTKPSEYKFLGFALFPMLLCFLMVWGMHSSMVAGRISQRNAPN